MKKKNFQSALIDPPGRYTGSNFLFKGGPSIEVNQMTAQWSNESKFPKLKKNLEIQPSSQLKYNVRKMAKNCQNIFVIVQCY